MGYFQGAALAWAYRYCRQTDCFRGVVPLAWDLVPVLERPPVRVVTQVLLLLRPPA
jgi:hypothetical protein